MGKSISIFIFKQPLQYMTSTMRMLIPARGSERNEPLGSAGQRVLGVGGLVRTVALAPDAEVILAPPCVFHP